MMATMRMLEFLQEFVTVFSSYEYLDSSKLRSGAQSISGSIIQNNSRWMKYPHCIESIQSSVDRSV